LTLAALATGFLVFCRVTGLVAGLPVFSAQGTPKAVPVFAALGVVLLVAPGIPVIDEPGSLLALVVGVFGELTLGLTAGLSVRIVFAALAMGTELMAMQMGLAMATMFNPMERQQAGPLGILASWLAGLVFLASGLHLRCLEIVAASFAVLPPGAAVNRVHFVQIVEAVEASVHLGVQISGPILVMVWFVNVMVAVLARLAPRMNVFFSVGMTLTSSLGILVLAVSLPWIMVVHGAAVEQTVARLAGMWVAP
jgi:flagellar biosynthetic protein FliR